MSWWVEHCLSSAQSSPLVHDFTFMKNKISLATLSAITSFSPLGPASLGSLLFLQSGRHIPRMQMSTWLPVNLFKYLLKYNAVQELWPDFYNCKLFPALMILSAMVNLSVFYKKNKTFNKIYYVPVGLLFIFSSSSSLGSMLSIAENIILMAHWLNQFPRISMTYNNYANLLHGHSEKLFNMCINKAWEILLYSGCTCWR